MPFLFRKVLSIALLAGGIALPAAPVLGSLRTANQVIVTADDVVAEDLYAVGGRTIVEGVVQGDLVVLTGEVIITGTVEGDVVGLVGGPVRISGEVGESVLVAAVRLETTGRDRGRRERLRGRGPGRRRGGARRAGGRRLGRGHRPGGRATCAPRPGAWWWTARWAATWRPGWTTWCWATPPASPGTSPSGPATRSGSRTPPRWAGPWCRPRCWPRCGPRRSPGCWGGCRCSGSSWPGWPCSGCSGGPAPGAVRVARERPGRSALVGLGVLVVPPILALPLFLTLVGLPVAILHPAVLGGGPVPGADPGGRRRRGAPARRPGRDAGRVRGGGAAVAGRDVAAVAGGRPALPGPAADRPGGLHLGAWEARKGSGAEVPAGAASST